MTSGFDPYAEPREHMIEEQLRARGIVRQSVLEAMRMVPRHLFVAHDFQSRAYADEALPSREGQTISQPYMVAVMTQELELAPGMNILELGTGTGYQTAILAELAGPHGSVYTIERVPSLAETARKRLGALDIHNVHYLVGDGSAGWPQYLWPKDRPLLFDRILVTAGVPEIPQPLLEQLRRGGIMVVPVGDGESQFLHRIAKGPDGAIADTPTLSCRFVPLLGKFAWPGEA